MKLIFAPAVVKALTKLPATDSVALMSKLKQAAENPGEQHPWAKRLTGRPGFRIRQGDWRAIYNLNYDTGTMTVEKIAKRDEAYK
jgi:mRNA interferase RelE/StbE